MCKEPHTQHNEKRSCLRHGQRNPRDRQRRDYQGEGTNPPLPPCNPRKTCYNNEIQNTKGRSIIMRCSCKECGVYMVQAESDHLGCVCPDCGYRCNDCLGTDTVVSRDSLRALAFDPRFQPENLARSFQSEEDEQDDAY